jgi:hypothetical protein
MNFKEANRGTVNVALGVLARRSRLDTVTIATITGRRSGSTASSHAGGAFGRHTTPWRAIPVNLLVERSIIEQCNGCLHHICVFVGYGCVQPSEL